MGPGLAQVFATAGYDVALWSRTAATLEKAASVITANLSTFADRELVDRGSIPTIVSRITFTRSLQEAGERADLLVETIVEDREAKKALYEELDGISSAEALLASDTSYLNIFEIVPPGRSSRTVIAHWFAPPQIIPLVEVVKGPETSQDTTDFVVEFLKKVDRVPTVLEKFVPGFCINRFLRIIGREIFFLMDNGYMTADQIDLAVKASIIPRAMVLGFVQRYDFTGIDLSYGNLQNPNFVEAPIDNQPKSLKELMDKGELGVKTGKGFFDYTDRPLEEVLKERDDAMIKVFEAVKDLIYKRV